MTANRETLQRTIEEHRDLLWRLQNSILQLAADPTDQGLAAPAAADLTSLTDALEGLASPSVLTTLREGAAAFLAGRAETAAARTLFELLNELTERPATEELASGPPRPEQAPGPAVSDAGPDFPAPSDVDAEDVRLFCAEAREHLTTVEEALLEVERSGSSEAVADAFRAVHSIKGGAQYVGLADTATVAHRTETLLDRLRRTGCRPSPDLSATLLQASDSLRLLVRAVESGDAATVDVDQLVARIDSTLGGWDEPDAPAALVEAEDAAQSPPALSGPPSPESEPIPVEPTDLELFSQEYRANLQELHRLLGGLDQLPGDVEELRLLARCLHSLKGIAGFVGAKDIERLASGLDLLLDRVFRHRSEIPPDVKRVAQRVEEALETLHDEAVGGGTAGPEIEDLVRQMANLSEREERTAAWSGAPSSGDAPSAVDPLRERFATVAASIAGDGERLRLALEELAKTAELQGLQELSDTAVAAARAADGFVVAGGADLIERLEDLLPRPGDLLSPEPSGEPRKSVLDVGPRDDVRRRVQNDSFDRDLVRIYLETTSDRLGSVRTLLQRGQLLDAGSLLSDMAAAAAYMGYDWLAGPFRDLGDRVGLPGTALSEVERTLVDATASVEELRLALGRTEPDQTEPARSPIAVRPASEPARAVLSDLLATTEVHRRSPSPTHAEAIREVLRSLRSVAASAGRPELAAAVGTEAAALEGLLSEGASDERLAEVRDLVERLFLAFGLLPPAPVLPAAAAVAPEPVLPPEASPDSALADGTTRPEPVPASGTPGPDTADAGHGLVDVQSTVRVDTKKIEDLMNMVAELVVNRSSFLVLTSSIREVLLRLLDSGRLGQVEARNLRHVLDRYDETTTDLGRVSNQLQEGVMRIRMMPVKTLFSRVPRLVRDLALREGKLARITFTGEETELDKTVIEQLSDPLVHLLRNAVSHGLESPAERTRAGKSAEGTLRIAARHQGNMVILEVEDDGRGVDLETVRRLLVERGLSNASEAARLPAHDLLASLFLPGFSTARSVSDISGRGVGLDVVKRNIEGLGGQVEVSSEAGRSTRFTIRIPLTMAIMQALLVRVASEVYSIPVSAVIQTVRVGRGEISSVEGQEVLTLRGRVVPLVRLEDVFEYRYHEETGQEPVGSLDQESVYAVVLQGEGHEIAVAAESLIGSQDLVIKSLEDDLVDARGVAGAAILGDGTVTLILDVPEIQKMAVDRDRYRERRRSSTARAFDRMLRDRRLVEHATVH